MNFCFCVLILLLVVAIGQTNVRGKKFKLKVQINPRGKSLPIHIRIPKTTRRKYIIKCCGFKSCLQTNKTAKLKTTSSTSKKMSLQTTFSEESVPVLQTGSPTTDEQKNENSGTQQSEISFGVSVAETDSASSESMDTVGNVNYAPTTTAGRTETIAKSYIITNSVTDQEIETESSTTSTFSKPGNFVSTSSGDVRSFGVNNYNFKSNNNYYNKSYYLHINHHHYDHSTFWTSGSNEDLNCDTSNKYAWCSTGYEVSPSLLSSSKFWLSANTSPSTLQRYKTSYGFWINLRAYTYLFGNKLVTWLSNWQQCCALGMEPLNMDNADEQTGLKGLTVRFKDDWKMNFNYWTSGTWQGSPQKMWSWCEPNGPTVFPPGLIWEAGQPDNRDGNETCVHFRFILNSTGAIMTDRNCTSKYVFACKGNLVTTPKPCVASCPNETCQRDPNLFNPTDQSLYNFFSYGTWYDKCGRNFLTYTSNTSNWATAWNQCCRVGMTLASMESAGKTSCYAKIVSKYAPALDGDFWVSGTDLGCVSNFRWCSRNQDFVDSELKWKAGHPKAGLNCVYLEVRNKSVLLATASCAEKKDFLCEVRKKNSYQKAMQAEYQIDLLLNVSRFLTTTVSLNLKCFLKCVGVEVGMFALGGLMSIETLRNIELVSQEEPKKLEQGFVAYDQCSGQSLTFH
ncbi:Hypothetical predicted protein [Cloeon dipterum]|uniref:C-type lectin domain-containing protein n=1 Tax=Cloeon dipterum TaxID=197152 RepID=A0A8S1E5X9_9INSE|nr:Hypothetical predicted protein [Cloeon dipterum]